jgi:hypothetical protein
MMKGHHHHSYARRCLHGLQDVTCQRVGAAAGEGARPRREHLGERGESRPPRGGGGRTCRHCRGRPASWRRATPIYVTLAAAWDDEGTIANLSSLATDELASYEGTKLPSVKLKTLACGVGINPLHHLCAQHLFCQPPSVMDP